jgi:hypothetical protein
MRFSAVSYNLSHPYNVKATVDALRYGKDLQHYLSNQ